MLVCNMHEERNLHYVFKDLQCWTGTHIIHGAIAVLISLVFILICLVISLTFFRSTNKSNNAAARSHSRVDVFILLMKLVLTYMYLFLQEYKFQWFLVSQVFIYSYIIFRKFKQDKPYINLKIQMTFNVLNGLLLWSNSVLLIVKVLEQSDFSGGLQLWILGLPLVTSLTIFIRDNRLDYLLRSIGSFSKGEEVVLQARFFIHLVNKQDTDRNCEILLKGYIYHHEDTCQLQTCQLKQYKTTLTTKKQIKRGLKKFTQGSANQDQKQILLQHVKNIYRLGIQKFPTSTSLKITYALFLMEYLNNKTEAISELNQASSLGPQIDEQFIIYQYKKLIEEYGEGPTDSQQSGGTDVASKFVFDSNFKQLKNMIEVSAQLHMEFWNSLREERPDVAKLNSCGARINQSVTLIESYWGQLQKLNPNVPKALRLYGKFVSEILNDKDTGQDLISRAKDAAIVRNNQYNGQVQHEDVNDMSMLSADGTPCISVTGDHDQIGIMTNCNVGASRIFGYTYLEMKNHNVEMLMPEMYAKNHSKILDDALAKGPENIPNKERLVFARHKSGYIFPVWLQLKMIQSLHNGVQFVALFKIDKKLISSNIGYVLLNQQKKIQGVSSSCIKLINLDIAKMRKLSNLGADIQMLAPELFSQEYTQQNYEQKQGAPLEWYLPDFEKMKQQPPTKGTSKSPMKSVHEANLEKGKPQLIFYEKPLNMSCSITTISMGELGHIGWYLRLEVQRDQHEAMLMKSKIEKLKQPLFQFRYDQETGKYMRELKQNANIDNARKDPNFINGTWIHVLNAGHNEEETSEAKDLDLSKDVQTEHTPEKSEVNPQHVRLDLNDEVGSVKTVEKSKFDIQGEENMILKKRQWGKDIPIYRLCNGKFVSKDYDEEEQKAQELEEQRKRNRKEEENSLLNLHGFKSNIKSRKALHMAIDDKSTPRAIKNLKITMNIVLLCLLALGIAEYVTISTQFTDINNNLKMVEKAYGRLSELQRIAYNIRSLVLINEGKLSAYTNYTQSSDYVSLVKEDIHEALTSLYDIQNTISLAQLSVSENHQKLLQEKSVVLYFQEQDGNLKKLNFTLTESVLQIASAIFTVRHLDITEYEENQQDVHFVGYNVFNDFLFAIVMSADYYVEDLETRSVEKNTIILTLLLVSLGTLVLTIAILFPVVNNVNKARIKVLQLFVDVPNYHILPLVTKCENFLNSFYDEQNDDLESDDGQELSFQQEDSKTEGTRRNIQKTPQNSSKSTRTFFIQFGVCVLFIMAYFIGMYSLAINYIDDMRELSKEAYVSTSAESYFFLSQNVQREMIYNRSKPILNFDSFIMAKVAIDEVYRMNTDILDTHQANRNILSEDYMANFDEIFYGDLCQNPIINKDLLKIKCEDFISGSTMHGLQQVLVRYYETLRVSLKEYFEHQQVTGDSDRVHDLFNAEYFTELNIMQTRFIQPTYRGLVEILMKQINDQFLSSIDTKTAAFIIFVIAMLVGFLILWTPFVNRLNRDLWRTKTMLTIIPIDVILKIPSIQEFLHHQSTSKKKSHQQQ